MEAIANDKSRQDFIQGTSHNDPQQQQQQQQLDHWLETSCQWGRKLAATASLAGLLMLSPPHCSIMDVSMHPPVAHAATMTTTTLVLAAQEEEEAQNTNNNVFDEVYNLIDKYFIDRTYNGQVRTVYMIAILFIAYCSGKSDAIASQHKKYDVGRKGHLVWLVNVYLGSKPMYDLVGLHLFSPSFFLISCLLFPAFSQPNQSLLNNNKKTIY